MADLRTLYLESCSVALAVIARSEVEDLWSSDSALPGLSVGGLAAHLGRALSTVDGYLQGDAPPGEAVEVDAAGYFAAVLGNHDPVSSEFHQGVRQRGESAAESGQRNVVDSLRGVFERLNRMPHDMDHQIAVLTGIRIGLGEYLKTRLVEIAVHCRDLSDSVQIDSPALPDRCWDVVSEVIVDVTARRNEPKAVALALARADRFPRVVAF